jgi:plasmid stability protein
MPSVQIKNVPDDVHAVLRRRAAVAGQSLQEYLLEQLTAQARRETMEEVFERIEDRRSEGSMTFAEAVRLVRADRDARP